MTIIAVEGQRIGIFDISILFVALCHIQQLYKFAPTCLAFVLHPSQYITIALMYGAIVDNKSAYLH